MKKTVRIGSRESTLAVWQAQYVADRIRSAHPEIEVQIITMKTTGDRILGKSLSQTGGKGLFVKELDIALMEGRTDLSVHSLKDVPMQVPEELPLVAFSEREDPRDALIFRKGIKEFPGMKIGTCSPRRQAQLEKLYPDSVFTGMRGNVHSRLKKLEEGQCDATVLTMAGLKRLGMEACAGRILEVHEMIPAAGQGILAVQGRAGEDYSYLDCVDCKISRAAALAEREFVRILDGGCASPIAAFAQTEGNELRLHGLYCEEKGEGYITGDCVGEADKPEELGRNLAEKLKERFRSRG